jgi:hypothetical protein
MVFQAVHLILILITDYLSFGITIKTWRNVKWQLTFYSEIIHPTQ